ncbi:MAG: hypothetical protein AAFY63_14005 [Cyanobacteria bacterium J06643_13]
MNIQKRNRKSWYRTLGALAIFSATIGGIESLPAVATSLAERDDIKVAETALADGVQEQTINQNVGLDRATPITITRKFRRRRRFGGHRRHRRYGHHGRHRRHGRHGRHRRHRGFKKFFF